MAKTVSGVTFQGTKGGKLDESRIPSDGYKQHYLYPEDTKSDSSYPVVDENKNLRRGNVSSAWELGARGGVDADEHDRKLKKLGKEFDNNPIPDDAYNAMTDINEDLSFHTSRNTDIDFNNQEFGERVGTGFNEYGVRENRKDEDLESVDVIFRAMEPGPPERRNGVRITSEFLRRVAEKDYDNPPHLKDHEDSSTFSRIGDVKQVWYSEEYEGLMLMVRTPNIEGSQNHQEAIARYTHNPPAIKDGSLGFGTDYEVQMEGEEPTMLDGKFREFSAVNFPAGYDNGGVGVNRAFSEAVKAVSGQTNDDGPDQEQNNVITTETITFARHGDEEGGDMSPDMEELSRVYGEWNSMVNMTERQMEMWEDHPCSNKGVDDGEERRDEFMMLMGQPMESWGRNEMVIANRAVDFMSREVEKEPENPENGGQGTCPSRWAVNLLNRGHNPLSGFPSGNPQFSTIEIEFDDPEGGENFGPDEE